MGVAGGNGPLRWIVEAARAAATREETSSPLTICSSRVSLVRLKESIVLDEDSYELVGYHD